MLKNIFGDIALDETIKRLLNVLSRLSFNNTSEMRVVTSSSTSTVTVASVSSGTIDTITTSNVALGGTTKNSTIQANSAAGFYSTVGRNFNRTTINEW